MARKPNLRLIKAEHTSQCKASGTAQHVLYVERLYHVHQADLTAYVMSMFPGDRPDAEVVVRRTYTKLLRRGDRVCLERGTLAYLFAVATNAVRPLLRDHLRNAASTGAESNNVAWQITLDRLKAAILALEASARDIFLLTRFEEMTYTEVAERLSTDVTTVQRHMSLAFQTLHQTLTGPPTPQAVRISAAQWIARKGVAAMKSKEAAAFRVWYAAHPEHRLAFEQCVNLWVMAHALAADPELRRQRKAVEGHQEPPRSPLAQLLRALKIAGWHS